MGYQPKQRLRFKKGYITSKEKLTKYVQNMHMDRNVNMAKSVNLYTKKSAKYMQNMGNVDLDKDVILVMI